MEYKEPYCCPVCGKQNYDTFAPQMISVNKRLVGHDVVLFQTLKIKLHCDKCNITWTEEDEI
jgi:hypothetical protein